VKLFVDKYGVNPPVGVEDSGQPESIHRDQHNTLMERGQGGEVDNDIGFFVNDTDDDYHSESELHDPYY
jgi:hypothetical protein